MTEDQMIRTLEDRGLSDIRSVSGGNRVGFQATRNGRPIASSCVIPTLILGDGAEMARLTAVRSYSTESRS